MARRQAFQYRVWFRSKQWTLDGEELVLPAAAALTVYEPLKERQLLAQFVSLGRAASIRGAGDAIRSAVLAFVRSYGVLRTTEAGDYPRRVAISEIIDDAIAVFRATEETRDAIRVETVNEHLEAGVRRVVWRVGPGEFTYRERLMDLISTIWLRWADKMVGKGFLSKCEADGCPWIFETDDPRQRYHDKACANRTRVRNWRANPRPGSKRWAKTQKGRTK